MRREYAEQRRRLSFHEYLQLFASDPVRYSRDAARYVRDMFDFYGTNVVERPWGSAQGFRLFVLDFAPLRERQRALVGQEGAQAELYRVLNNLVREGRPNRLLLLHGPNGSAKSTVVACILRALEHYSTLDVGALYRFHWVFPKQEILRGTIGFGGRREDSLESRSYAHLSDHDLDARLVVTQRDHPLFLLPVPQRAALLTRAYREAGVEGQLPAWIEHGSLSLQNRQIYEGLLQGYDGSLLEVLRHVQVERYFVSRRYRTGAVSIGPQLSVDASERQLTADRSVAALPPSLQALSMFEAYGELVDATGGVIEFSDLLKRPLEAFKYLQTTVETGEVSLATQNIELNCVMLGSANEEQLMAFREHPEFQSFRGRLELVRMPYLLSWVDEQRIYDGQIAPQVRRHVAPHATEMAARFAVLTRLRRPDADSYSGKLGAVVGSLTALEKCDLYGPGTLPGRLDEESSSLLRAAIPLLYREFDVGCDYEGSNGASPREMRGVLLDAAQNAQYACLSPWAVLDELDALCQRTNEYAWLRESPGSGGYHDHAAFRAALREKLLDEVEDEFRMASGLVEEDQYAELLERYILHVSYWVKGEKLVHPLTRQQEPADESLMREVEALIFPGEDGRQFRQGVIGRIAGYTIERPDRPLDARQVFAPELARMRQAVFAQRREALARLCDGIWILLREEGSGLDDGARRRAQSATDRLKQMGYDEHCAADAARVLARERFADVHR
ncbi:MAG: serine protein kinase PrkA [Polyangiaceae bacterium]|nr:serine protein kinase PrkA [Polyangiaceae bacterium]